MKGKEIVQRVWNASKKWVWIVLALAAGWAARGFLGGPGGPPGGRPPMPPPAVDAMIVRESDLDPAEQLIARVEAIEDLQVRAEVAGTVAGVHFSEGAHVEQGDLLFTIEAAPFEAEVAAREADLAQANAELARAERYYNRLREADARSVSQSALDTAESDWLRAQAAVKQAEAGLKRARIHLGYTEIRAAVSGRIGKARVTRGNYVSPSSEPLARIVQIDPVRVAFSVADRDIIARQVACAPDRTVRVRLPDGTLLEKAGAPDFSDNVINPLTGTVTVRYRFDNPEGILIPGGFVTAEIKCPTRERGLLIPQRALLMDQAETYVLVLDDEETVERRAVTAGMQIGRDVVIESGLEDGERIVVDGVQNVTPGATVRVRMMQEETR